MFSKQRREGDLSSKDTQQQLQVIWAINSGPAASCVVVHHVRVSDNSASRGFFSASSVILVFKIDLWLKLAAEALVQ